VDCASCGAGGDDGELVCRGLTAVPGCVEGTVRVILDPREADRLVAGEILVTPMTDPDSVPAMSRAAAVVTDRGGVLCHAAITTRDGDAHPGVRHPGHRRRRRGGDTPGKTARIATDPPAAT
jgi:hypothetical protein